MYSAEFRQQVLAACDDRRRNQSGRSSGKAEVALNVATEDLLAE